MYIYRHFIYIYILITSLKVWAIGHDDRCLYYRTGITRSELTGKRWKLMNAPLQLSRASSNASLSSSNRHSTCGTPQQQRHQSWSSLVKACSLYYLSRSKILNDIDFEPSLQNRPHSTSEGTALIREWEEQSRSAPTPTSLKLWQRTGDGISAKNMQQTSFQDMYLNEERKRWKFVTIICNGM